MLRTGSRYTIGKVTHVFPHLQLKGNYTYTAKDERQHLALLQMLHDFDTIADTHSIDYTICGCTLLGAMRHDGFVPWDSNANCDVPVEQVLQLEQSYHRHQQYTLQKTEYGYKISHHKTLFPFIDIFLTEFSVDQQKYQYVHKSTRDQYPAYRNSYSDIHPRRGYVFEDLTLWGPCNGLALCQRIYGEDCLQVAQVTCNGRGTGELCDNVVKFFQRIFHPHTPTTVCPPCVTNNPKKRS